MYFLSVTTGPVSVVPGSSASVSNLAVSMHDIRKRFGSVVALDGVDFQLNRGEIHALLGENGAGKSTLMNLLYGLEDLDEGKILINGDQVKFRSPQDAVAHGIGMVHQHFKLVPRLTVVENVILGDRGSGTFRLPDLGAAATALEELAERYGLAVSAHDPVGDLSVGEQQRVEILRSLYFGATTLILDEPTASLTPLEVDQMLEKLRDLSEEGTSIVVITHHLDEAIESADRVTILRGGVNVGTMLAAETTPLELARLMVGREVRILTQHTSIRREPSNPVHEQKESPVLRLSDVRVTPESLAVQKEGGFNRGLFGVDLEVYPGEIVTVAGVEGNGQAELENVLIGFTRPSQGSFLVDGEDCLGSRTSDLLHSGIGYIPSDRYRRGLIGGLSVAVNVVYDQIGEPPLGSAFRINPKEIMKRGEAAVEEFSIATQSAGDSAGTLSGGNAQRVVIARAFAREPRLLVAAQPTRGLDVGAIEFIWDLLNEKRSRGLATLLITTDLDEVMSLSDRVYVIYRGRLSETPLDRDLIGLAMGGAREPGRGTE